LAIWTDDDFIAAENAFWFGQYKARCSRCEQYLSRILLDVAADERHKAIGLGGSQFQQFIALSRRKRRDVIDVPPKRNGLVGCEMFAWQGAIRACCFNWRLRLRDPLSFDVHNSIAFSRLLELPMCARH